MTKELKELKKILIETNKKTTELLKDNNTNADNFSILWVQKEINRITTQVLESRNEENQY